MLSSSMAISRGQSQYSASPSSMLAYLVSISLRGPPPQKLSPYSYLPQNYQVTKFYCRELEPIIFSPINPNQRYCVRTPETKTKGNQFRGFSASTAMWAPQSVQCYLFSYLYFSHSCEISVKIQAVYEELVLRIKLINRKRTRT